MRVDRIKMTASRGGPGYFCVSSLHMSDIQSFTLTCSRIGCSLLRPGCERRSEKACSVERAVDTSISLGPQGEQASCARMAT